MQFEIYRWINSVGRSTAVVSRLTTSMECKDISMLTSVDRYLQQTWIHGFATWLHNPCVWSRVIYQHVSPPYSAIWAEDINLRRHSIAISGLWSTRWGSLAGVSPEWYTSLESDANLCKTFYSIQGKKQERDVNEPQLKDCNLLHAHHVESSNRAKSSPLCMIRRKTWCSGGLSGPWNAFVIRSRISLVLLLSIHIERSHSRPNVSSGFSQIT